MQGRGGDRDIPNPNRPETHATLANQWMRGPGRYPQLLLSDCATTAHPSQNYHASPSASTQISNTPDQSSNSRSTIAAAAEALSTRGPRSTTPLLMWRRTIRAGRSSISLITSSQEQTAETPKPDYEIAAPHHGAEPRRPAEQLPLQPRAPPAPQTERPNPNPKPQPSPPGAVRQTAPNRTAPSPDPSKTFNPASVASRRWRR